jgi:hypothetical protein
MGEIPDAGEAVHIKVGQGRARSGMALAQASLPALALGEDARQELNVARLV